MTSGNSSALASSWASPSVPNLRQPRPSTQKQPRPGSVAHSAPNGRPGRPLEFLLASSSTIYAWRFGRLFGVVFLDGESSLVLPLPRKSSLLRRCFILMQSLRPAFLLILLPFVPESPRWLITRGRYKAAYQSLVRLRKCRVQAARDLYEIDCTLRHIQVFNAKHAQQGFLRNAFKLFTVPRNRRGATSAGWVLFMQQVSILDPSY